MHPRPFEPDYAVHPGKTLLECIVWQFAYSIIAVNSSPNHPDWLKDKIGDDVQKLTEELIAVIEERAPMTEELAKRLPTGLPSVSFWVNYQRNYERDLARIKK